MSPAFPAKPCWRVPVWFFPSSSNFVFRVYANNAQHLSLCVCMCVWMSLTHTMGCILTLYCLFLSNNEQNLQRITFFSRCLFHAHMSTVSYRSLLVQYMHAFIYYCDYVEHIVMASSFLLRARGPCVNCSVISGIWFHACQGAAQGNGW